jgi:hypothetical protein
MYIKYVSCGRELNLIIIDIKILVIFLSVQKIIITFSINFSVNQSVSWRRSNQERKSKHLRFLAANTNALL